MTGDVGPVRGNAVWTLVSATYSLDLTPVFSQLFWKLQNTFPIPQDAFLDTPLKYEFTMMMAIHSLLGVTINVVKIKKLSADGELPSCGW